MKIEGVNDAIRLIFASLFIMGVLAAILGVLSMIVDPSSWWIPAVSMMSFMVLIPLTMILFNPRGTAWYRGMDHDALIEDLEDRGLILDSIYEATRAFQVVEFEDEGSGFYIELENGSVLFLSGQYLYDYEGCNEPNESFELRRFPCTSFTIRRHKEEGYVVEIVCRGEVLEPECSAPPFDAFDIDHDLFPGDGGVIVDKSYDELKAERMGTSTDGIG